MKQILSQGVYALGEAPDAPLVRVVWSREDGDTIRNEVPLSALRSQIYRCAIAVGRRVLDSRSVQFPEGRQAYRVCEHSELDVTQKMGWHQPQTRLLVENRLSWSARLLNWLRPLQHLMAR